jgi:hypothetical protein
MGSILGLPMETGITELIGINEKVDQNDYSGSVTVALGQTSIGVIDALLLVMSETGDGEILDETGVIYIFDTDPAVSSGDTALATEGADHLTTVARIDIASGDWEEDANGGTVYKNDLQIPFQAVSNLYIVYRHTGATSINSGAGDDEMLDFNLWYRRTT